MQPTEELMHTEEITASPKVQPIVTGHFWETAGYHTRRPQGTSDWLLILTLAGLGRFGHQQGQLIAQPHDLILLRPGTCHDYGVTDAVSHWELLWAHFQPRPEWLDWLGWPEEAPGLMRLTLSEPILRQQIIHCVHEMHRLATGGLRHRDLFAMNALEAALLWADALNPRTRNAFPDPRVQETVDYLCHHLGDRLNIALLAERAGVSSSRLAHLFRAQVGMPPQQFLEEQRLQRAQQLLARTSHTVQRIAEEVGFENSFYFSNRFKKRTGLSPSAYRHQKVSES